MTEAGPSILPPVPMADHMAVVKSLSEMQQAMSHQSSVVDVLTQQIGQLHAAMARQSVDLAISQQHAANLQAQLDAKAKA